MEVVTNVPLTSPTGGLEMHVFQVSRELARRGHGVHLLYTEAGSLLPEYDAFCRSVTQVTTVDYWYPTGRRALPGQVVRMVPAIWAAARRRPDILYGNRVMSNGWTVPAGKLTRAPVVCHEHGFLELSSRRIDFINRHVDRFIMISQFVADPWLAGGLDPDKVTVIHNGIDPAEYPFGGLEERNAARRSLGIPEDPLVVTFLGRLDRVKGVEVLLRAWQLLGWGPDQARLVILGSSVTDHDSGVHLAELHELAGDGVHFLPAQRDVTLPLHAADVVVVPSLWDEPFGRVVIEALSTGRPVLASRVGGIPEILTGPLERFLFERGDVAGLAERLAAVAEWRDDEPELAEVCASRVREGFTLEQMVDGVEAVFRTVVTT